MPQPQPSHLLSSVRTPGRLQPHKEQQGPEDHGEFANQRGVVPAGETTVGGGRFMVVVARADRGSG